MERLQRFLARAGVASRRASEALIAGGKVAVNGRIVTEMGVKVDPERDRIMLEGRLLSAPSACTYVMLNKPAGYVTTMHDPQGRPRVIDLLPAKLPRLFPVGRLDLETTGLLLLTNDGDLAQHLLHPRFGVWKTYLARVAGVPSPSTLAHLRQGVLLEDGPTAPAGIKILNHKDGYATLEIRLHEGRKRQIRRMLAAVGHQVLALERRCFGPLSLGDLPLGASRSLTGPEVEALRRSVAQAQAGMRRR